MQMGKLLIAVIALSALAGCAKCYHMPRDSEPHATLTFEKPREWFEDSPTPLKLNGVRRNDHVRTQRRCHESGHPPGRGGVTLLLV